MGANYTKCLLPISPNKVDILPLSSRINAVTPRSIQKEPVALAQLGTSEDKREEIVEKNENEKMAPLLGLQVFISSKGYGQILAFVGNKYGKSLFIVQMSDGRKLAVPIKIDQTQIASSLCEKKQNLRTIIDK